MQVTSGLMLLRLFKKKDLTRVRVAFHHLQAFFFLFLSISEGSTKKVLSYHAPLICKANISSETYLRMYANSN